MARLWQAASRQWKNWRTFSLQSFQPKVRLFIDHGPFDLAADHLMILDTIRRWPGWINEGILLLIWRSCRAMRIDREKKRRGRGRPAAGSRTPAA